MIIEAIVIIVVLAVSAAAGVLIGGAAEGVLCALRRRWPEAIPGRP